MMLDLNAGPKKRKPGYSFSICHSNLNSIAAHNLEKLGLLKTYYTGNKFDINFLSESYPGTSILSDIESSSMYLLETITLVI